MSNFVELKNVRKIFDKGVEALKEISFTIRRGEFVGIVGPSGSGKSTLLHIMGGVEKPTEGSVIIEGKDITSFSEDELSLLRRKKISYVFQFFYLLEDFNCFENLVIVGRISSIAEPEEKALKILKDLGLEEKAYSYPSELSGGQQQRLAIGRALMTSSELIIADEPTGNLDSKNAEGIFRLLRELNRKGTTVVVATHNENFLSYFDKIIMLEDGRIKDVMSPK